ncbi:MAG: hypothetical protein AAFP90_00780 [Planctomycetota bacterium]
MTFVIVFTANPSNAIEPPIADSPKSTAPKLLGPALPPLQPFDLPAKDDAATLNQFRRALRGEKLDPKAAAAIPPEILKLLLMRGSVLEGTALAPEASVETPSPILGDSTAMLGDTTTPFPLQSSGHPGAISNQPAAPRGDDELSYAAAEALLRAARLLRKTQSSAQHQNLIHSMRKTAAGLLGDPLPCATKTN